MGNPAPRIEDIEAVSKEVTRIITEGDLDGLRRIFTPDATVWHNFDNREKTVDETIAFVEPLMRSSSRPWYTDERLSPTPTGFVKQHYVRSLGPDGQEVSIPVCLVFTLEGTRIKRMDEYLDATAFPAAKAEQEKAQGASLADLKAVVNRQFDELINGRRLDLAPQFFHPDMDLQRMGIQKAAEFLLRRKSLADGEGEARPDMSGAFQNMGASLNAAFPDLYIDVVGPQVAEGDLVVTRVMFTGTHKGEFFGAAPTNRKITFYEVLFMRLKDGKISETWALGDELSFLQQLGVLPE